MLKFKDDIVSIIDSKDKKKYYGQITAFITNSYAKHYIFLIWLVPKNKNQNEKFVPENYVHGIAEERPIPADSCEFECTCPLVPRYMHTWTPEQLLEEQNQKYVLNCVNNIRKCLLQPSLQ